MPTQQITDEELQALITGGYKKRNFYRAADFALERGEGTNTASALSRLLAESFLEGFEVASRMDDRERERAFEYFKKALEAGCLKTG